jgi:arylformamidase
MPPVFLDYDQAGLDAAYEQSVHAPNMSRVLQRYASMSDTARKRIGNAQRVAYGATAPEQLDLYVCRASNAPVMVFVHGGAWKAGAARNYAFLAEPFLRAGAHVAILDFAPVQELGGDLRLMAEQVRRGWHWVASNAAALGGDPARLYLAGHSSGAHLASVCLMTDWRERGLAHDCVRGALLSSGVYELQPVALCARNAYMRLNAQVEEEMSAQRHPSKIRAPVIISHGSEESPEFVRQAQDFAQAVRAAGGRAELLRGNDYNHFEILETLGNPHGLLGCAMLRLMGLA